jgi:hypothetical protein
MKLASRKFSVDRADAQTLTLEIAKVVVRYQVTV